MFNEKRYVWNYLFNGLFEWFSEVNYPERVLEVSNSEKLAEEWFRLQECKSNFAEDDTE